MEKSLLITSDNSASELACAFERALKFLPDEKYKIEKVSYEFNWEKPPKSPDILVILDTNLQSHSYTAGIHFLRRYLAKLVEKTQQELPPATLLSFNTLQELFQEDKRHIVVSIRGIEHIKLPVLLDAIVRKIGNSSEKLNIETAKEYLKLSCELGFEKRIEHARRNFIAPYSLILGARYVNDISGDAYKEIINSLNSREATDELRIYEAVLRGDVEEGIVESSKVQLLSEILKGKRILLIDDECKTAGWEEVLRAIFGPDITLDTVGKENNQDAKWQEWADVDNNSDLNSKLAVHSDKGLIDYDLILMDLYLTEEDNKKKEDGSQHSHKYSGLQLLGKIRKKDKSVPVILFTASNKAFNVKAAETIGIDNYFQKEGRYHNKEEAVRYYEDFKMLVGKNICQERVALRRIWKGVKDHSSKQSLSFQELRAESLLNEAYYVLQGYLQDKQPAYLSASFLLFDEVLKLFLGNAEIIGPYAFDKILENVRKKEGKVKDKKVKKLHAFIVRQLRNSFAHLSTDVTFEDVLFTFYSLLNYRGISVEFKWEDLYSEKTLINELESMIKAVCDNVCQSQCFSWKGRNVKDECRAAKRKSIEKAKFLSLEHNLEHKIGKGSDLLKYQAFFKYSFYVLCLNEMGEEVPDVVLPLLKSRLFPIAEEVIRKFI